MSGIIMSLTFVLLYLVVLILFIEKVCSKTCPKCKRIFAIKEREITEYRQYEGGLGGNVAETVGFSRCCKYCDLKQTRAIWEKKWH